MPLKGTDDLIGFAFSLQDAPSIAGKDEGAKCMSERSELC